MEIRTYRNEHFGANGRNVSYTLAAQVWHLQQGILKDEEDNRASNSGHSALQGTQFKPP